MNIGAEMVESLAGIDDSLWMISRAMIVSVFCIFIMTAIKIMEAWNETGEKIQRRRNAHEASNQAKKEKRSCS